LEDYNFQGSVFEVGFFSLLFSSGIGFVKPISFAEFACSLCEKRNIFHMEVFQGLSGISFFNCPLEALKHGDDQ
jgi:hypothetical protein